MYAKALIGDGFDDMDVLVDIEDADMKESGIPRGHAVKLRKRLREYQSQQYANEPVHIEAAPSKPQQQRQHQIARHQQVLQVRTPLSQKAQQIPASAARHQPTAQMKSAVQQSWEHLQAMGTYKVGEALYRHTFAVMPEAIQLFPSHVRLKYREWSPEESLDESNIYESPALRRLFSKFVNAVGCAVTGLNDSSTIVPMLTQLGARHINYGVSEVHWQALGKAFTNTLREILREDFTPEVEAAWSMAYSFMSSIMMAGLRQAITMRDVRGPASPDKVEKESQSGASTTNGSVVDDLP